MAVLTKTTINILVSYWSPIRGTPRSNEESESPNPCSLVDCSEAQLTSSDPSLRSYSAEDTSSGHSILDPYVGGRCSLEIEAAVHGRGCHVKCRGTVRRFCAFRGTASADKLASPHHFED